MKPQSIPPQYDSFPTELRAMPVWMLWDYQLVKDRRTKVPRIASGEPGSLDRMTLPPGAASIKPEPSPGLPVESACVLPPATVALIWIAAGISRPERSRIGRKELWN